MAKTRLHSLPLFQIWNTSWQFPNSPIPRGAFPGSNAIIKNREVLVGAIIGPMRPMSQGGSIVPLTTFMHTKYTRGTALSPLEADAEIMCELSGTLPIKN